MYPDIQKRLEKNEILHLPGANLSQIKNQSVILTDKNGNIRELEFDFVLAMTGYNPPVGFLKKLEIELEPETNIPVHDPVTLETPTPGVFVAGVITGGNISGKVFIENSRNHGEMILPRLNEILK
jgi:thioredoxin reductase (NADPH)